MRLVSSRQHKSLKPADINVDVEQFVVLTGPNGAGKSNLLEAIQIGAVTYDDLGSIEADRVKLFGLGELTVATEGPVQGAAYKEPWANLYNSIQSWISPSNGYVNGMDDDQVEAWLREQIIGSRLLLRSELQRLVAALKKPLKDVTTAELAQHGPILSGVRDPFTASIAEVFLTYNGRLAHHEMEHWRYETRGGAKPSMTDEEFSSKYGPKPWQLLDQTLSIVGLDYRFVAPEPGSEQVNYEVLLLNNSADQIRPADLSSGERVLLAVALSLYSGANLQDVIELPHVLLLDEADASLHPSMVKSLLSVIQNVFVDQFNVRVILSTHSPSTVALAPEESIFVMNRSSPRLQKSTTDQAMKLLTVGMSSLSVKLENRRQVFVESEYDQAVYQALFPLLKGRLPGDRSLEFIAAGKRDVGGGCDMVMRLVADLREAGVDTVNGVIDRDRRTSTPPHVFSVADRYSIENLVFDPLLLGVILLREGIVSTADLGLPPGLRAFELREEHAPSVANAISSRLGFTGASVVSVYVGDFTVEIPNEFLELPGHDLEAVVIRHFPQLLRFKQGLKTEIVKRAGGDVPAFLPKSVLSMFGLLLEG